MDWTFGEFKGRWKQRKIRINLVYTTMPLEEELLRLLNKVCNDTNYYMYIYIPFAREVSDTTLNQVEIVKTLAVHVLNYADKHQNNINHLDSCIIPWLKAIILDRKVRQAALNFARSGT